MAAVSFRIEHAAFLVSHMGQGLDKGRLFLDVEIKITGIRSQRSVNQVYNDQYLHVNPVHTIGNDMNTNAFRSLTNCWMR